MTTHTPPVTAGRSGRWVIWAAGLSVALGAAVATAHGLYEVAIAATVPAPIAWLYPLITDGLALVAYASTTRLAAGGRRYAWAVVVLAAGLSGLAQASYLAIGVHDAPTELRFGVGAWPAVAAAITAHLLYLLAARPGAVQRTAVVRREVGRLDGRVQPDAVQPEVGQPGVVRPRTTVQPGGRQPGSVVQQHEPVQPQVVGQLSATLPPAGAGIRQGGRPGRDDDLSRPAAATPAPGSPPRVPGAPVQPADPGHHRVGQPAAQPADAVQPDVAQPVQSGGVGPPPDPRPGQPALSTGRVVQPVVHPAVQPDGAVGQPADPGADAPIDRATATALAHQDRHGDLPSVSQLAEAADVARGTAATALKRLRDTQTAERPGLHVVHDNPTGTSR